MKMTKMLIPLLFLLMLTSTTIPAMAIGPQKAEKNPHIMIMPEGAEILLPNGVVIDWMADTEISVMDFVLTKDASRFKIRNAPAVTIDELIIIFIDPVAALEYENEWFYVPYEVLEGFLEWLIFMGFPISPEEVELILSMYPEGMYMKFVNVGK